MMGTMTTTTTAETTGTGGASTVAAGDAALTMMIAMDTKMDMAGHRVILGTTTGVQMAGSHTPKATLGQRQGSHPIRMRRPWLPLE